MEKADILEMAVKHLRQIQRQQYTSGGADPTLSDKYRLGFNECAQEVSRYLGAAEDDDAELRARLLNHLANCITSSDSPSPLPTPSSSPGPVPVHSGQVSSTGSAMEGNGGAVTPLAPIPVRVGSKPGSLAAFTLAAPGGVGGNSPSAALVLPATTEINNNVATLANNNVVSSAESGSVIGGGGMGFRSVSHHVTLATATSSQATSLPVGATKVIGELQVMPPKTATGEVAFVLPASMMAGGHVHSYIIPVYTSHQGLTAASLTLTNNAQAPAALPTPLPIMAMPQVSGAGAAPSLVTLAPGSGLCPAVLPPSSVGHVVATGLNASLAWQPAATVYSSPSSATSSCTSTTSSSSTACVQITSPALAGPSPSTPSDTVTSVSRMVEGRSTPFLTLSQEKFPEPQLPSHSRSSALLQSTALGADGCSPGQSGGGSSLLHPPLVRPPPSAEMLRPSEESVWRPW